MNSSEIYERVTTSADRFGARNPQQLAFLSSVLAKCEPQQLAKALIEIFTRENSFDRQELSGLLLIDLRPRLVADLHTLIESVLGHWDRSVEQLPHYFAYLYGAEICKDYLVKLLEVEPDDDNRKKLETMLWWIRNRHH